MSKEHVNKGTTDSNSDNSNSRISSTISRSERIPSKVSKINRIPSKLRYVISSEDEGKVFRVLSVDTAWKTIERWGEEQEVLMLTLLLKREPPLEKNNMKIVRLYYPLDGGISPKGKAGAFLLAFIKELGEDDAYDPENWIGHLVKIERWREADNKVKVVKKTELAVTKPVEKQIEETVKEIRELEKSKREISNRIRVLIGRKLDELVKLVGVEGSGFKNYRQVFEAVAREWNKQFHDNRNWKTFKVDYWWFYRTLLSYHSSFIEYAHKDRKYTDLMLELADYFKEEELVKADNPVLEYFDVLVFYKNKRKIWDIAELLAKALREKAQGKKKWTADRLRIELEKLKPRNIRPPTILSIFGQELHYKRDLEDEDGLAFWIPVTCDEFAKLYVLGLVPDDVKKRILQKLRKEGREKLVEEIEKDIAEEEMKIDWWLGKVFDIYDELLLKLKDLNPAKALAEVDRAIKHLTEYRPGISALLTSAEA